MTVRDLCIVGKAGSLPDGERKGISITIHILKYEQFKTNLMRDLKKRLIS